MNPGWVRVAGRADGGMLVQGGSDVLVVDDTWVSGGSAQSAAAALKLAGARRVAVVVLGRHVNPADPRSAAFLQVGTRRRRGRGPLALARRRRIRDPDGRAVTAARRP